MMTSLEENCKHIDREDGEEEEEDNPINKEEVLDGGDEETEDDEEQITDVNEIQPTDDNVKNLPIKKKKRKPNKKKEKKGPVVPTCIICKIENPKYKCPKCLQHYCSVACCKTHKETACTQQTAPPPQPVKQLPSSNSAILKEMEQALLTDKQKERLKNSKELRSILKSQRLRSHFSQILSADNRLKKLSQMRQLNPEFGAVIELMLDVMNGENEQQR
jgi:hypothetical protein